MKKLLLVLFTLIYIQANAQRKETDPYSSKAISLGGEFLIPGKSDFKIGGGISGRAEYPITDLVSLGLVAGYDRLYYKQSVNENGSLGPNVIVPIKATAVFFLDPDLYCNVDAGSAIGINYDKRKTLALAFGVGYIVPVRHHQGVDVSFRFDDWGKTRVRQVALRVAYRLDW
jgi:hypothetical protein